MGADEVVVGGWVVVVGEVAGAAAPSSTSPREAIHRAAAAVAPTRQTASSRPLGPAIAATVGVPLDVSVWRRYPLLSVLPGPLGLAAEDLN